MIREPLQRSIGINDVRRPLGAKRSDIRLDDRQSGNRREASSSMAGELSTPIIVASGQASRSRAVLLPGPQPRSTASVAGWWAMPGEKLGGGPRAFSAELQIK